MFELSSVWVATLAAAAAAAMLVGVAGGLLLLLGLRTPLFEQRYHMGARVLPRRTPAAQAPGPAQGATVIVLPRAAWRHEPSSP